MDKDDNSRKTILLVDDDETHLTATEASIKNIYDIHMVKSGKEALELLGKTQIIPDLIMLDIMMPEMDGWAVFDRISDIASLKFTPIMFFTSVDDESSKEKAYALGALDYIVKPCKKSILLERIEDTLQKAELKRRQFGM
jgi:response regulator RpfG family c-di-GMP phosphodiesterase